MTSSRAWTLELPSFYCPIPPAIHPQAEAIERGAIAWLDEVGLYPDATERAWGLATRSAEFSCRLLPYGDRDAVALFAKWNYFAFFLDDWHDSGDAATSAAVVVDLSWRMTRALETGARLPGSDRLTVALNDLVLRTRAATTPVRLRRLADGLRDWLFGAAWLAGHMERRVMPAPGDYVAVRPSANGTRFSLAWAEIAGRFDLTQWLWGMAAVQGMLDDAGLVVSIDNDIIGYAKDEHLETPEPNLVNVLAHHHGWPLARAVTEATVIRDDTMRRYVRVRDQLAAAHTGARRYLDGVDHYLRGALDWMSSAPRYASPRNRHELPVTGARLGLSIRDVPSVEVGGERSPAERDGR